MSTLVNFMTSVVIVFIICGVIGFFAWANNTDTAHPEDFVRVVTLCELNEGWKTLELNTPGSRTAVCNNGAVFTYKRGAE